MSDQAGEKNEEPTEQRLREAARKGEVLSSRDFTCAFVMLAFWCAMAWGISHVVPGILAYARHSFRVAPQGGHATVALMPVLTTIVGSLLLPVCVIFAAAVAVSVFQTKGIFSFERLKIDLSRATPKLNRIVSKNAVVEVLKGTLKLAVLAFVSVGFLRDVAYLARAGSGDVLHLAANVLTFWAAAGWKFVGCLAIMGGIDFLYEWKRYRDGLKMTHQEVKQEHKNSEGDPHHKAERQRVHREVLEQRALDDVKKAKFIVVNPDHIAVAIDYDENQHEAPVIIAKGENLMAERIKEIARQHGVPIFRDITLARSLNRVDEGDEIPAALYEAVAELLRVIVDLDARNHAPEPASAESPVPPDTTNWTRG